MNDFLEKVATRAGIDASRLSTTPTMWDEERCVFYRTITMDLTMFKGAELRFEIEEETGTEAYNNKLAEFEDRLVQWIRIMEGTNESKREELDRAKVMEARSKFKDEEGEECPISEEEMLKAISEMRDNLFPSKEDK